MDGFSRSGFPGHFRDSVRALSLSPNCIESGFETWSTQNNPPSFLPLLCLVYLFHSFRSSSPFGRRPRSRCLHLEIDECGYHDVILHQTGIELPHTPRGRGFESGMWQSLFFFLRLSCASSKRSVVNCFPFPVPIFLTLFLSIVLQRNCPFHPSSDSITVNPSP